MELSSNLLDIPDKDKTHWYIRVNENDQRTPTFISFILTKVGAAVINNKMVGQQMEALAVITFSDSEFVTKINDGDTSEVPAGMTLIS